MQTSCLLSQHTSDHYFHNLSVSDYLVKETGNCLVFNFFLKYLQMDSTGNGLIYLKDTKYAVPGFASKTSGVCPYPKLPCSSMTLASTVYVGQWEEALLRKQSFIPLSASQQRCL